MCIGLRAGAVALAVACGLALSGPASALVNGGFESGLAGWTAVGDVSVQTSLYQAGPTAGAAQALLTTALEGDDAAGGLNASGTAPEPVGLDPGLETGLGLGIGALDALFAPDLPYEGSGIAQAFTAAAGTRLAFDWSFLTSDDGSADFAFVALDGVVTLLADGLSASLSPSPTAFDRETGFNTYLSGLLTGGSHTLVVGVVDLGDSAASSALLVDDAQVVPLPAAAWLMGAALAGLAGFARRRER